MVIWMQEGGGLDQRIPKIYNTWGLCWIVSEIQFWGFSRAQILQLRTQWELRLHLHFDIHLFSELVNYRSQQNKLHKILRPSWTTLLLGCWCWTESQGIPSWLVEARSGRACLSLSISQNDRGKLCSTILLLYLALKRANAKQCLSKTKTVF